jgi:hypothetical protein
MRHQMHHRLFAEWHITKFCFRSAAFFEALGLACRE